MTDLPGILTVLRDAGVEFIVVGGVAGNAHGMGRLTHDVDVSILEPTKTCVALSRR